MLKNVLLISCCCCLTSVFGIAEKENIEKNSQLSPKEYLEINALEAIDKLELHRKFLNEQGENGDDFIISLFEIYLQSTEINLTEIDKISALIKLGEKLNASEEYLPDSVWTYVAASDMIFGAIAEKLQNSIDKEEIDLNDFNVKYIIQRLIDNKYAVNVPMSNWVKLSTYIREGRWDYIWHKFTSTYKKEFGIAIVSSLVFLWTCFGFYRFRSRQKQLKLDSFETSSKQSSI